MTSQAHRLETAEQPDASAHDALRALLIDASAGCSASFAQLYEHTHRRVFAIVLRIVGHRAEAEEIVQDIYVKVWFRSAQFDPCRGQAVHWLSGIAHRASIDALRRSARRVREVTEGCDDADAYARFASSVSGPPDLLEEIEDRRAVHEQLSALPEEQRESLAMAFFDGLTHHEIASRLQCPLGTVKSRVRRALIAMRG